MDQGLPALERLPGWAMGLVAAVTVHTIGAGFAGFWHWNVGAGAVFALFLLAPTRQWAWIYIGTCLSSYLTRYTMLPVEEWVTALMPQKTSLTALWFLLIGNLLDPLFSLGVAWGLRRHVPDLRALFTLNGTAQLHIAALMAALLCTVTDILWVFSEGYVGDVRHRILVEAVPITADNALLLVGTFALKNGLGYFLGIMLVAPFLLWLLEPSARRGSGPMLREAALVMLPITLLFLGIVMSNPGTKLAELLRLLLLAAVVVFAMRHGWRGAVFSVVVVSVAFAVEDHSGKGSKSPIWLQMFVAISGAMSLLFGATIDDLRHRVAELQQASARQRQMAGALMSASLRNARVEDEERRRMALELHDSLGQGITAMQTQLKLIELDQQPAQRPWLAGLRDLASEMRESLREVLEALRPSALRELGFEKALGWGSIRQQAERAGLHFDFEAHDLSRMRAVDEAVAAAAYRMVQEAVTNAIRHSRGRRVAVRVRVGRRCGSGWLLLCVEDDGFGGADTLRLGHGLAGVTDRAVSLGGGVRLDTSRYGGLRLRGWLRLGGGDQAGQARPDERRASVASDRPPQ